MPVLLVDVCLLNTHPSISNTYQNTADWHIHTEKYDSSIFASRCNKCNRLLYFMKLAQFYTHK